MSIRSRLRPLQKPRLSFASNQISAEKFSGITKINFSQFTFLFMWGGGALALLSYESIIWLPVQYT